MQLTHRPTALPGADSETDRTVMCAGRPIGRAILIEAGPQGGRWRWAGFWIADHQATVGIASSLDAALTELKAAVPIDVLDRLPPEPAERRTLATD